MPRYGNIFYTPGLVRASWDDPALGFLGDKLVAGEGVNVTFVPNTWDQGGNQLVISAPGANQGVGDVVTVTTPGQQLPEQVSLVLIDASQGPVEVIFPDAGAVVGWITMVCLDNSNPITLTAPMTSTIFAAENVQFSTAGDAFVFASNRKDTWYAISRYTANWYS